MNTTQGTPWGNPPTSVSAAPTPVAPTPTNPAPVTQTQANPNSSQDAQGSQGAEFTTSAPPYATASLYIGDLSEDVTEPVLYEVFSQPASVASIRICRDSQTQRSLGYGYVNYHTIPDAERAMDVLNFTAIKGRPCRIMWANRDKATRVKSENNVFVKNLDRNIDNKSLFDTFSLFGQIVSCKVATDSSGRSLGYGYVQYEKEQSLVDAIKRVNGMQIGNNTVYCGRHKRKEDRQSLRDEKFTNLYIKGYDNRVVNAETLRPLFENIGTITSQVTKTDDKCREAMFINYEHFDTAKDAVKLLNNRRFTDEGELLSVEESERLDAEDAAARENGTYPEDQQGPYRLYVSRHQSRAERDERLKQQFAPKANPQEPQPTVLYVRHFPMHFNDDDLKTLFEPFGIVTSAKVAIDEQGNSRGFGFVTIPEAQDAQKAITGLHDTIVPGTEVPPNGAKLYVAYLEPKETRQSRLKAQIAENIWRPNQFSSGGYNNRSQMGQTAQPGYPTVISGGARMHYPNHIRNQAPRGGRSAGRPAPRPGMGFQDAATLNVDSAMLHEMGFKEQKQAIGDRLYHVIMARQPALAGKITGMMLEMPNEDLLNLLQRPDELSVKIDEAIEVLKAAGGSQM